MIPRFQAPLCNCKVLPHGIVPLTLPAAVLGDALQLAAEIATLRGDGERLLLSLTGRSTLPSGYSVV